MLSSSKIALFLPLQEHGHILPTLKLAERLSRDGWTVRYLAAPPLAHLVEARGFEALPPLDEVSPFRDERGVPLEERADLGARERLAALQAARESLYRQFDDVLARERPGALFVDFFQCDFAARALPDRARVVVYHTTPDIESLRSPPLIRRYGPPRNPIQAARLRLDWLLLWHLRRWRMLRGERLPCVRSAATDKAWREHGVPQLPSSMVHFGGDLNTCVLGAAALSCGHLPPERYFGLCLREEEPAGHAALPAFDRELPLVYLSFGSLGSRYARSREIMRGTIEALRASGRVNLIAQAGGHYESLADLDGGNVRVLRFAQQLACLKRASAVITHGGYGTVKECVARQRPMLIVPFFQDQLGNGRRCAELGIAETLDWRRFDAKQARRSIERLVADPAPRARLAELYSPQQDDAEFERAYAWLRERVESRAGARVALEVG